MSNFEIITAEVREDVGKGASRRLRREGKIPAVLYGGDRPARTLTLQHDPILHATENESFYSSILEIQVEDGRKQKVILRDIHRHPFKPLIVHVDFQRINEKEALRLSIPLHFMGEEESPAGREAGVVIQHQVTEVEVSALPGNLPEYLEVNLSGLDVGEAVMLSEIVLPEGVTIPALAIDDNNDVPVANAIHIRESQGEGVAEEETDEELSAEVPTLAESEEGDAEGGEAAADEGDAEGKDSD